LINMLEFAVFQGSVAPVGRYEVVNVSIADRDAGIVLVNLDDIGIIPGLKHGALSLCVGKQP
ncbi:MAG: hypothetical protein KKB63_06475, partial [Alphaproteobacteria bacterium]|nr:hypothetical protein [Alphaproteobacteria bacterium]